MRPPAAPPLEWHELHAPAALPFICAELGHLLAFTCSGALSDSCVQKFPLVAVTTLTALPVESVIVMVAPETGDEPARSVYSVPAAVHFGAPLPVWQVRQFCPAL